MDRKARAEGRPQDATPEIPLEGWGMPRDAPASDTGIQQVESALRARFKELEDRWRELENGAINL